jgi:hypothetical protein
MVGSSPEFAGFDASFSEIDYNSCRVCTTKNSSADYIIWDKISLKRGRYLHQKSHTILLFNTTK